MIASARTCGTSALKRRHNRRRAVGFIALLAAVLHGGVWPLLAVAATSPAADGWQFIEICTSDGVKQVPLAGDTGGLPIEAPIPAEHSECATCICTSGGCAGAGCVVGSEIIVFEPGSGTAPLVIWAGHRTSPYAFSLSRDPPEL